MYMPSLNSSAKSWLYHFYYSKSHLTYSQSLRHSLESTKTSSNIPYVVLESTRAAVGIRTRSNLTMTVAAVDGNPPLSSDAHPTCHI